MKLLKEIDESAKYHEFRVFLTELADMDADMQNDNTHETIQAKMELLQEIGRGDFQAHDQMARAAGGRGHEYNPNTEKAFRNPRLGLQPQAQDGPEEGANVKVNGKWYKVDSVANGKVFLNDPKAAFAGAGGETIEQGRLKPVQTAKGVVWVALN